MQTGLRERDVTCALRRRCVAMQSALSRACVHTRKYQFAMHQVQFFADKYSETHTTDTALTSTQEDAFNNIMSLLLELHGLICSCMARSWLEMEMIESHANAVLDSMITIYRGLVENIVILDNDLAKFFLCDEKFEICNAVDLHVIQKHISTLSEFNVANRQFDASDVSVKVKNIGKTLSHTGVQKIMNFVSFPTIKRESEGSEMLKRDAYMKEMTISSSTAVSYGHMCTGEEVAIKAMEDSDLILREVMMHNMVSHPCFAKLKGLFRNEIVTEWAGNSTLFDKLRSSTIPPTDLTIIAFDLARGLHYLEQMGIVHGDIKSSNVLLDDSNRAKIIDMGTARHIAQARLPENLRDSDIMSGTARWMSPERMDGKWDTSSDVYAYGVVLYEMLTSKVPLENISDDICVQGVICSNDKRPEEIPADAPHALRNLIEKCWLKNWWERPTFSEILVTLRSGEILYEGADWEAVKCYMDEKTKLDREENSVIYDIIENSRKEDINVADLASALQNGSVPDDCVDTIWEILQSFTTETPGYVQCLVAMLDTAKILEASTKLKSITKIEKESIDKIIQKIPTGNNNIDINLALCACHNGRVEDAAIHSIMPLATTVCLDLIAQQNPKLAKKKAVLEKCLSVLSDVSHMESNLALHLAAFKCVISINKCHRLSYNILLQGMSTKLIKLVSAAVLAFAAVVVRRSNKRWMVISDRQFTDLFDKVLTISCRVPMSACVLSAACACPDLLKQIMRRLEEDINSVTSAALIPVLEQAVKHPEYRDQVRKLLQNMCLELPDEHIEMANDLRRSFGLI